jgi:hypothetical protein
MSRHGGPAARGRGAAGGRGQGSLGTSAPSFHSASKRAPQGPGSRRGSGRGRRNSNTRTRAGEVVLPGGRVLMGCLPPTHRIPPRRRRLRACPWRFGPVLEFGLGRCPRLCCGCWPWFPGAFRGGFRAGVFLGGLSGRCGRGTDGWAAGLGSGLSTPARATSTSSTTVHSKSSRWSMVWTELGDGGTCG